MKVEEAVKIKEKLDEALLAVDEYGKQAEQFSKTRDDLYIALDSMNNANNSLGLVLKACDQYLNKATDVIDGEYFAKIQGIIYDIKITAENLEKCNNNTSEESVKLISESKKELTKLADTLSDNVQKSINRVKETAEELQEYTKRASKDFNDLIESNNSETRSAIETLKTTCAVLNSKSEELKTNDSQIINNQNSFKNDFVMIKDLINTEARNNNQLTNDSIEKLVQIENILTGYKNEIKNDTKEIIEEEINELKKNTDSQFSIIQSMIDEERSRLFKTFKRLFLVGGILAFVMIVLLIFIMIMLLK